MLQPLIEAHGIAVSFGHIRALGGASLAVYPSEKLALVGDNGAGKTTLVRVLGGELTPNEGQIFHRGVVVRFGGVQDAQKLGIHIVYQDLALCPDLTAAENLILGHEPLWKGIPGRVGFIDRRAAARDTKHRLSLLQITLPSINARVRTLSGGQRQALAVARGLTYDYGCMLMDEPTASLGAQQTAMVYRAFEEAAKSGVAVVVVSHDLSKVLEYADRVAVMRHGRVVAVEPAGSLDVRGIIDLMMGTAKQDDNSGPNGDAPNGTVNS